MQQSGTVDHTPVYPREVVKRALELSASALILVHNHPSGDPSPSAADIEMAKEIAKVAKPLGIIVHDHIIVGRDGHTSLKGLRLVEAYHFAMRVSYSGHAEASLLDRELDREWVERTLRRPEVVEPDPSVGRLRAFRAMPERDGRVLRVVYVRQGDRYRVITVFFDRGRRR